LTLVLQPQYQNVGLGIPNPASSSLTSHNVQLENKNREIILQRSSNIRIINRTTWTIVG
jgi:hypothetical protein